MSYEEIRYEVDRDRARITLNRPRKRNAITRRMTDELEHALWRADCDTAVHSVILRGAGPSFCSGYDLGEAQPGTEGTRGDQRFDDLAWQLERNQRPLRAFADLHKPVIAQVHGHCLAGGTGLALFCDITIVADDATIGFPAARAGTLPNQMWLYNIGPQWTKRLLMTGDSITGAEAAHLGLVLKAVPAGLLEAEVEGLADRFGLVDTDLLSSSKRIVNIGLELMGAGTLQRLATEMDARGHLSESTATFYQAMTRDGIKAGLQARDAAFGDGRARVLGPEIRDAEGRLVDPS